MLTKNPLQVYIHQEQMDALRATKQSEAKPMSLWNQYHTPTSILEALALLHDYGEQARIVAGGTDLLLDLQFGNHPPVEALVDVTRIVGLNAIRAEEGWVVIGAAVTHTQIERSPLVREHGAALVESCSVVGGPQVRNVATIGGNVRNALPAADGTVGLLALDAEAQVYTLGADGDVQSAWQPLIALFAGPGRNTLGHNPNAGGVSFSCLAAAAGQRLRPHYAAPGRRPAILGVAAKLTLDEARARVIAAAIAIGPAGPIPFRATDAEAVLVAAPRLDEAAVEDAIAAAQAQAQLRTSRHRASKEYRHEMVAVLLRRVLGTAAARAGAQA